MSHTDFPFIPKTYLETGKSTMKKTNKQINKTDTEKLVKKVS